MAPLIFVLIFLKSCYIHIFHCTICKTMRKTKEGNIKVLNLIKFTVFLIFFGFYLEKYTTHINEVIYTVFGNYLYKRETRKSTSYLESLLKYNFSFCFGFIFRVIRFRSWNKFDLSIFLITSKRRPGSNCFLTFMLPKQNVYDGRYKLREKKKKSLM